MTFGFQQISLERGLCFNHGIERLLHLGRQIGVRLAKRSGLRKAKVAVARKLAVILHRMWTSCPRACRQANSLLIFFLVPGLVHPLLYLG